MGMPSAALNYLFHSQLCDLADHIKDNNELTQSESALKENGVGSAN